MRRAWAAVIALIVLAAGIFVYRTVNAPDSGDVVARTTAQAPEPTAATTTTTPVFVEPSGYQATKVVRVVAVDKSGNPAPGYSVGEGAGEVPSCQRSSSGLDAGVVGCAPNAAGADVCWVTPTPRTVLCGNDPWDKALFRLTTGQLVEGLPEVEAQPWGLELEDGAKCQRRGGGAWPGRADGLAGAYSCDREGEFVLADDGPVTDRAKPAWTVKVGGLSADNASFPPPVDMRVVTAYFAASP